MLKPSHSKRWRAGPASSNIANHLGLRRQSIAATALSPGTNGCALIHASHKAVSRCACPRTPRRALTSQASSNLAQRLDFRLRQTTARRVGAFTAAFPRSAAVLQTSRSTSANMRRRFFPPVIHIHALRLILPPSLRSGAVHFGVASNQSEDGRRGHSVSRFLFVRCASRQLRRTTFQETRERFTFSPGEKAGMRASVKPISNQSASGAAYL